MLGDFRQRRQVNHRVGSVNHRREVFSENVALDEPVGSLARQAEQRAVALRGQVVQRDHFHVWNRQGKRVHQA